MRILRENAYLAYRSSLVQGSTVLSKFELLPLPYDFEVQAIEKLETPQEQVDELMRQYNQTKVIQIPGIKYA